MNKAFLKEPDLTADPRCPRCGGQGTPVFRATLEHHLSPEGLRNFSDVAYFCNFAGCDVAYFDTLERVATTSQLLHPVTPKDPAAPLCACIGLTKEDVEQDVAERGNRRVKELWLKTQTPDARCATLAANGQCCLPEVQKYFLRLREQHGIS